MIEDVVPAVLVEVVAPRQRSCSEYLFSLPSVPSKPGTVTVVIGPSFSWNVVVAG